MRRQRARHATVEAEPLVEVKVRLPASLVQRIDDTVGSGQRAACIRDTLADRLRASPAVEAAQRLLRVIEQLGPLDQVDGTTAAALVIRAIAEAASLRAAVVDDMLARAGYRRAPR